MTHPIKVLQFICPTGFYGAERWILALAKHLDVGEAVCELAVTMEPGQKPIELLAEYGKLGMAGHVIPMKGRFDLSAVKRLAELLRSRRFDIIHTHGYKSDIMGILAARMAGIRSVVTPHGFENARDFKLRAFIWLGCQAMRFATIVAPLSEQLAGDSLRIGVRPGKIRYIQNGVDLSEVEEAPTPAREAPQEKRIGFIGQMISRKNIADILDVFEELCRKHPDARLFLLGDGESREALERRSRALESRDRIEFLGFRDDRLSMLKSFDLFVMSSTLEGIPRCLMEAAAAGVPVAAYGIPGVDQIIRDGETGLLAPLGDKAALLSCWERLLFDPGYGAKLAENSRRFVYERYSARRMASEYASLFREIVSGVSPAEDRAALP